MPKTTKRPVIVCTEYRGVFFGYLVSRPAQDVAIITNAKMAIYWGTTRGINELAHTGPNIKSKISLPADKIELNKVTCIIDVNKAAETAWINA